MHGYGCILHNVMLMPHAVLIWSCEAIHDGPSWCTEKKNHLLEPEGLTPIYNFVNVGSLLWSWKLDQK